MFCDSPGQYFHYRDAWNVRFFATPAQTSGQVSSADGKFDVFVRGSDQKIWKKSHSGVWQSWVSMGGPATGVSGSPAASSWAPDRVEVTTIDASGHPYIKSWNGTSWSGWSSIGGTLGSKPAAVSWYNRQ